MFSGIFFVYFVMFRPFSWFLLGKTLFSYGFSVFSYGFRVISLSFF